MASQSSNVVAEGIFEVGAVELNSAAKLMFACSAKTSKSTAQQMVTPIAGTKETLLTMILWWFP